MSLLFYIWSEFFLVPVLSIVSVSTRYTQNPNEYLLTGHRWAQNEFKMWFYNLVDDYETRITNNRLIYVTLSSLAIHSHP